MAFYQMECIHSANADLIDLGFLDFATVFSTQYCLDAVISTVLYWHLAYYAEQFSCKIPNLQRKTYSLIFQLFAASIARSHDHYNPSAQ